ncbi:MAG: TonB-dependent receptor plug domain-containing protein, partial [Deltaproteobacteria bacterium]|nr:TonB-dependent receptor plug domain-containing protein [Deltaproteobacteria bacterium]
MAAESVTSAIGPATASDENPTQGSSIREEIVVIGHRGDKLWLATPASVGIVDAETIQRGQQLLQLGESLAGVPGVFIQNRSNFAQDSRISIRGFGSRASFGIRGIRLIVDGIPLTMPDGQGQVDSLDLASAGRIEILRGPSASLYGSSSGGIIEVTSEAPGSRPTARSRVAFGSYGYRGYHANAIGAEGDVDYLVSLSRLELDGYRDHARMENVLFNSKFRYRFDETSDLSVVVNHLYAPKADDPGGLTAAEVAVDRRAAQARNLLFDAGESIDNTILGLVFRKS